jgi:hypothetical protein
MRQTLSAQSTGQTVSVLLSGLHFGPWKLLNGISYFLPSLECFKASKLGIPVITITIHCKDRTMIFETNYYQSREQAEHRKPFTPLTLEMRQNFALHFKK